MTCTPCMPPCNVPCAALQPRPAVCTTLAGRDQLHPPLLPSRLCPLPVSSCLFFRSRAPVLFHDTVDRPAAAEVLVRDSEDPELCLQVLAQHLHEPLAVVQQTDMHLRRSLLGLELLRLLEQRCAAGAGTHRLLSGQPLTAEELALHLRWEQLQACWDVHPANKVAEQLAEVRGPGLLADLAAAAGGQGCRGHAASGARPQQPPDAPACQCVPLSLRPPCPAWLLPTFHATPQLGAERWRCGAGEAAAEGAA